MLSHFSKVAVLFYILTSSIWGFQLLHILHKHLIWSDIFILVILIGVQWHLLRFLICIFLMTNDIEYMSRTSLSSYISFGEVSLQIFCPLFNGVVFLLLSFVSSLNIMHITSFSDIWFCTYFLPGYGLFFSIF